MNSETAPTGDVNAIKNVTIVIPCYNEERRLDKERFRSYLLQPSSVRLLFVDDGSRDNTKKVLNEVCAGLPQRAAILVCKENGGKAEAVRLGLLAALHQAPRPDVVGFWDADLATPLDAIKPVIKVLCQRPDIEMVFGSRVKLLGRYVKRNPGRHYLGRVFATVVSSLLELPIYDTQCGAKVFRVSSGIEELLHERFLSKWVFDVEIIARYLQLYGRDPKRLEQVIYEYPLEVWADVAGSKVKPRDFLTALLDILQIRSKYLRS